MTPRSVYFLLLALPLSARGASDPVSPEQGAVTPADIADFKQTAARFAERELDFTVEARFIADAWEAEQRARLKANYAMTLDALTAEDKELRDGALAKFEAFLVRYPESRYTPHVMFRLGELYFELTEETFFDKEAEYSELVRTTSEADTLPEAPMKDYERSVGLYRRIIRDYPQYEYADGAYYMLGYCLSRENAVQFNSEEARQMFASLVEKYPKSNFAGQANLRLGEYYFDRDQPGDLDIAVGYYQKVVDEGKSAKLYDQGLYKLAWSYYRQAKEPPEYERAISLFSELLDFSQQKLLETGKESGTAPEAIQYMAISFSDLSDKLSQGWAEGLGERVTPIQVAQRFFEGTGSRDFEIKIYKKLAEVLTQQARYEEAMATLSYLQERWPNDPENPTFQRQVAQLNMNLSPPRPDEARQALLVLEQRYNDNSPWAHANRSDPDALAVANRYVKESLSNVAYFYYENASLTGNMDDYRKAVSLYQEYLTTFPFADDYYEIQSYLGAVLLKTARLAEAEKVFEQLLKSGDNAYHDSSLWQLMQTRKQLLTDKYGKPVDRPADAVVEKTVPLPSGKERTIYTIDEDHKRFIEVCDALVASEFKNKDYAEALNADRAALAYLPAQILYNYGRFDEARPRFDKIISTWPQEDEAAYSASLMVDSYTDEEDLAGVRAKASKYAGMRLGKQTELADTGNEKFKTLEEGATFNLAMGLKEKGDAAGAAEAFVAFMAEFPKSQYFQKALFNAANNYEVVGRIDDANRLFEEYVNRYPKDEQSAFLFYRIASNYSSVLELDKSIRYYETLVTNFPKYADASGALYNAGFLRVGKGDHEGAARNFERYAREYSGQADAEDVLFQAGDQWEKVGAPQAAAFYQRYLRAYPDKNPDHVMEVYHRLALAAEKSGNARAADKAWVELAAAFNRLAATGNIGPAGRHYAAASEFRKLQAEVDAFKIYKFTASDEKNAKLILEDKKAAVDAIINHGIALIDTYKDFEYSSAALYVSGDAYYAYADMLFKYPCPAGFTDEMCAIFTEKLDPLRLNVEDKGHNRLVATLETAAEQKHWSEWQVKALQMLSERDPANYSPDKQEIRGVGDSNLVPLAGPMPLRKKEEPAPATPPAAPENQP